MHVVTAQVGGEEGLSGEGPGPTVPCLLGMRMCPDLLAASTRDHVHCLPEPMCGIRIYERKRNLHRR